MKKLLIVLSLFFVLSCEKDEKNDVNFEKINLKEETGQRNSDSNMETIISEKCSNIAALSKTNLSKNSCTFINPNRITEQTLTHGILQLSPPSESCLMDCCYPGSCFPKKLRNSIQTEILYHNAGGPVARMDQSFVKDGEITLLFSDIIDSSNLMPYISAINANIVYREITCQIQTDIESLSTPAAGTFYGASLTWVQIDYSMCGGPTKTTAIIYYDINLFE